MSSLKDILGDRAKMEAERLARNAKKRGASPTDPLTKQETKRIRRSISPPPINKTVRNETGKHNSIEAVEASQGSNSRSTQQQPASALEYPQGALKKTWCFGYDRNKFDIKIEEVLRKRDLKIAVLSSWQIDMEWLMSKLDTDRTNIVLVYGEKDPARYDEHRAHAAASSWGTNLHIAFPPMAQGPYTCMHSKLMLLFYGDSMRVVVPSANLLGFDWGESGVMENSVFLIDLPRVPAAEQGPNNTTLNTPFAKEVFRFVEAKRIDDVFAQGRQNITTGMRNFDWTATKDIAFIHTIGQTFYGDATKTTGLNQLARSVRELDLASKPGEAIQIDYSASSIGAVTEAKVEAMNRALRGLDQETPTGTASRTSKSKPTPPSTTPQKERAPLHERFRIHFPSNDYVLHKSKGGPDNAGTQFMTPGWNKPSFPLALLRDFESRRPGCLSHNKFIVVRTARAAYVYSGSANFSQSAWGNLTFDRGRKEPKLACANWECGVLIKIWPPDDGNMDGDANVDDKVDAKVNPDDVSTASESETESEDDNLPFDTQRKVFSRTRHKTPPLDENGVLPLSIFDGKVDIPYNIPGKGYIENDLKPWIQLQRR